ncbi:hypothetical protein Cni_G05012 [Canna indica]|uniref:Reverse transcriptase domain-containing protein n=1 Tax=Canna indica TaxID=4628 RepID=A0AAQ3JY91_9LILI|nr:hypothetical protein Cni_G05012 [Canna indica]
MKESALLIKLDTTKAFDSLGFSSRAVKLSRLPKAVGSLDLETSLNHLINRIRASGTKEVVNLEFADDFMVFIKGTSDDITNLKLLLYAFEMELRLQVNYDKSTVTHLSKDEEMAKEVVVALGCKVRSFPIKYLGLPLRNNKLCISDWIKILYKLDKRLQAGRVDSSSEKADSHS